MCSKFDQFSKYVYTLTSMIDLPSGFIFSISHWNYAVLQLFSSCYIQSGPSTCSNIKLLFQGISIMKIDRICILMV